MVIWTLMLLLLLSSRIPRRRLLDLRPKVFVLQALQCFRRRRSNKTNVHTHRNSGSDGLGAGFLSSFGLLLFEVGIFYSIVYLMMLLCCECWLWKSVWSCNVVLKNAACCCGKGIFLISVYVGESVSQKYFLSRSPWKFCATGTSRGFCFSVSTTKIPSYNGWRD